MAFHPAANGYTLSLTDHIHYSRPSLMPPGPFPQRYWNPTLLLANPLEVGRCERLERRQLALWETSLLCIKEAVAVRAQQLSHLNRVFCSDFDQQGHAQPQYLFCTAKNLQLGSFYIHLEEIRSRSEFQKAIERHRCDGLVPSGTSSLGRSEAIEVAGRPIPFGDAESCESVLVANSDRQNFDRRSRAFACCSLSESVSYTHLTLPTKRIV